MANYAKFGQSGWIARPTRRLYIVNGSKLVTAEKQQAFLPVANSIIAAKGTIASGQAVERVWEGNEEVFKLATSDSKSVYFANADSTDWDVLACGKLPAIYAGDDFEIQTPFFDQAKTYNAGDPLYISLTAGTVTNDATVGGPVVGIVSKGVINLGKADAGSIGLGFNAASNKNTVAYAYANAHTGVNATGDNDVANGAIAGGPRVWTNDTDSQYVLQFYTKYIPAAAE